jgi:hypothetical protein
VYEKVAAVRVDTAGRTPAAIAEEVSTLLGELAEWEERAQADG